MILSILKDTGMRPVEIERTCKKWFDLTRGAINVETAKHGNGRTLGLSSNTLAMVNEYFGRTPFGMNDKIFPRVKTLRSAYTRLRRRTAEKLQRPELLRISLYSFRHYFATMLYHKTKDILYVKQQMGHKNLENTLIYTHLVNFQDDEYHARTATTKEEALTLIEAGFEYVTEMEGMKLFRKRK
jgi:integrase